jgi:hypothetical protein
MVWTCKRNGHNKKCQEGYQNKHLKVSHEITLNKMVQFGTRRHQEERKRAGKKEKNERLWGDRRDWRLFVHRPVENGHNARRRLISR